MADNTSKFDAATGGSGINLLDDPPTGPRQSYGQSYVQNPQMGPYNQYPPTQVGFGTVGQGILQGINDPFWYSQQVAQQNFLLQQQVNLLQQQNAALLKQQQPVHNIDLLSGPQPNPISASTPKGKDSIPDPSQISPVKTTSSPGNAFLEDPFSIQWSKSTNKHVEFKDKNQSNGNTSTPPQDTNPFNVKDISGSYYKGHKYHRPSVFDGNVLEWVDFKDEFAAAAQWNHWSEEEMGMQLRLHLKGEALKCIRELPNDQKNDFKTLCSHLEKCFDPPERYMTHKATFRARKLLSGETAAKFGRELQLLAGKAYPKMSSIDREELILDQFCQGIAGDESMQDKVYFSHPKNIHHAIQIATEHESLAMTRAKKISKPNIDVVSAYKTEVDQTESKPPTYKYPNQQFNRNQNRYQRDEFSRNQSRYQNRNQGRYNKNRFQYNNRNSDNVEKSEFTKLQNQIETLSKQMSQMMADRSPNKSEIKPEGEKDKSSKPTCSKSSGSSKDKSDLG